VYCTQYNLRTCLLILIVAVIGRWPSSILHNGDNKPITHFKQIIVIIQHSFTLAYKFNTLMVIVKVFVQSMVKSSMLDLHYRLFGRYLLYNHTEMFELQGHINRSHQNDVRCSKFHYSGHLRSHSQLLRMTCNIARIMVKATRAITLRLLLPTAPCQSLHIKLPGLVLWIGLCLCHQSPPSAASGSIINHHVLVR
jgi:hypothetical protein